MARNGIPRVCFYICSTERNSEFLSFPLECSEGNSERLLLFFVQRNGIPSSFLFRGRVRNGIPRFSVPRNSRNSVGNNHLFRLFRLPRNCFFCRKLPTLGMGEKEQTPPHHHPIAIITEYLILLSLSPVGSR
jgi:hypothetical protein